MNDEAGILSFGAYIPRKRLKRAAIHSANAWFVPELASLAKGERAICDWDEDSVTMAVEAARDTLLGFDRALVNSLSFASTTFPFIDRLNSGIVKEALALSDQVAAIDVTGSQRAATSALIQALRATTTDDVAQLCLASEMRKALPASRAELVYGDAAAGILVGSGDTIARFLGSHSVTLDFVDHYRSMGMKFDYEWEPRWIRDEGYMGIIGEAMKEAMRRLEVDPATIDRCIVPIGSKGVLDALVKRAGIRSDAVVNTLATQVGECGVAHAYLLLAASLEQAKPGEKILLIGFGQGVDLLMFEAKESLRKLVPRRGVKGSLARGVEDTNYIRWLFHRGILQLERGMRAELDQKQPGTTLWRHRKAVLALMGSRCTVTGTVQFPGSDISVDSDNHHAHTQEDYCLAERRAHIVTYTADNLTYTPSPPAYYGMVDFEGGGRMIAEFADVSPDEVEVGREMRMVFRIKAADESRGFIKYFWKAAPVV